MRRFVSIRTRLAGLLLAVVAGLTFSSAAMAQELPKPADIAGMDAKGLESLVGLVSASIGQDSLKLRSFAGSKSCLELLRAANSFDLAYGYLADVVKRADVLGPAAGGVSARAGQARVLVFAARVRAAEFRARACGAYVVPAEQAADPRYQTPPVIADSEYARALIEARQAAEITLGASIFAARNRQCDRISNSLESVSLLLPYLDKLLADVTDRPYALGPKASRRALNQMRNQLVATANQIAAQFDGPCRDGTQAAPATPQPAPGSS